MREETWVPWFAKADFKVVAGELGVGLVGEGVVVVAVVFVAVFVVVFVVVVEEEEKEGIENKGESFRLT